MSDLSEKRCLACEGYVAKLTKEQAVTLLEQLTLWNFTEAGDRIEKTYAFKNYYETMAFVNALSWIAHQENHHPDMKVGYNYCVVSYSTHAVGGLTENDFICAAKIDTLLAL